MYTFIFILDWRGGNLKVHRQDEATEITRLLHIHCKNITKVKTLMKFCKVGYAVRRRRG